MAYTEFFVTKGSAVSDVNGGGPNLGTNDGPVDTSTNCSSDGAGTAITDDDAGGWPNSAVDDWICFDTAGTKDYARITNITGEVLTVTPAVALSASSKTVNVGGAWATVDHGVSTMTTGFVNAAGDKPRVNVKSGTYNEHVATAAAGTTATRIRVEGYGTTPGDSGTMPEVNDNTGDAVVAAFGLAHSYWDVVNIYASTAKASDHAFSMVASINLIRCRGAATGSGGVSFSGAVSSSCQLIGCWSSASDSYGFHCDDKFTLQGCLSSDSGSYGFYAGALNNEAVFIDCIADSPNGDGFFVSGEGILFSGCITYNSTTGSGVRLDNPYDAPCPAIFNCLFVGNNQYGIESDLAYREPLGFNAFYDNGSDGGAGTNNYLNGGPSIDGSNLAPSDVQLSGDPFTDAANGDFSLNDTAGAGAACRDAGFDAGDNIGHG